MALRLPTSLRWGRALQGHSGVRMRGRSLQIVEVGAGHPPSIQRGAVVDAGGNGDARRGEREMGGWIRGVIEERGFRSRAVSAVVDDDSLYMRNLEIPAGALAKGRGSLAYLLEPFLPYPVADAVLQVRPADARRTGTAQVILVALKRRSVDGFVGMLRAANLDLVRLDVPAYALARLHTAAPEQARARPALLADATPDGVHVAVVLAGMVAMARVIRFTGSSTPGAQAATEILFTTSAFQDMCPAEPAPKVFAGGDTHLADEVLESVWSAGLEGEPLDPSAWLPLGNDSVPAEEKDDLFAAAAAAGMAIPGENR